MTKILTTTAAALMLSSGMASAATVWGQDAYGNPLFAPSVSQSAPLDARTQSRVYFGTGYNGRGTATGGPVGGLPNRN